MFLDDIIGPMSVEEAKATSQRLDAKCWKGYRKAGTKIKGGVRVNNCVPNESQKNEGLVGGGKISPVPTDAQLKKMIWDALKIDAPTGVEALQKAIVDLTQRPQTRMVQTLLGRISMIADRMNIGPEYRNLLKKFTEASMAEDNWHGSTDAWHAGDNAWSSDQHEMVEYVIQGPSPDDSQSPIPGNVEEDFGDNPVAGAIVRRIMTQHTDLLKQYGPDLVGAAVDNVADYVGDVEEIGSSDVSGWVAQVERMLKENPPEAFAEAEKKGLYYYVNKRKKAGISRDKDDPRAPTAQAWKDAAKTAKKESVDEEWSKKYKSSINCSNPKGFSQKAHCAGKKKHEDVEEGQTDYQKRRQRERDIDAGRPVTKQRQSKMTDYQKRRAQDKRDMEFGESTSYWVKLQDQRSTKLNTLVNELKESVEDIK